MYGPCFSSIVGGHPLRSPTRRRLGEPLPRQLADGTQVPPKADCSFSQRFLNSQTTCGISNPFGLLFHTLGQVTHALLTRSPLGHSSYCYKKRLVRLACIRHAASVHPEPGSNSPQKNFSLLRVLVYGLLLDSTELLLPITIQLSKCRRSGSWMSRSGLLNHQQTKNRCPLSTSARQTAKPTGLCL